MLLLTAVPFTIAFLSYLVWTHLLFSRTDPGTLQPILRRQRRSVPSWFAVAFGFRNSESRAVTASVVAFVGSLAASVYGITGGVIQVTVAALAMGATAWTLVAQAYALTYLRLHANGETFKFEHGGEASYGDFFGLALMVSAAGSHISAVPTTRMGTAALRRHTIIAFVFNALVIAMTVSLITTLVASHMG